MEQIQFLPQECSYLESDDANKSKWGDVHDCALYFLKRVGIKSNVIKLEFQGSGLHKSEHFSF